MYPVLGCLLLPPLASTAAIAATVNVAPTRVDLRKGRGTGILTLTNNGSSPARFEASAFLWSQSEKGEISLEPTTDLVVYPSVLELPPGGQRIVRVGTQLPVGPEERTFRLVLEERPVDGAIERGGLQILTRLSIPVFQPPQRNEQRGDVETVAVMDGKLTTAVRNDGNRSVMLKNVSFVARASDGAVLWEGQQNGWYVLAGDRRLVSIDLPSDVCPTVAEIEVSATVTGDTWTRRGAPSVLKCR